MTCVNGLGRGLSGHGQLRSTVCFECRKRFRICLTFPGFICDIMMQAHLQNMHPSDGSCVVPGFVCCFAGVFFLFGAGIRGSTPGDHYFPNSQGVVTTYKDQQVTA